jgi:small subunit ribosomal protein S6
MQKYELLYIVHPDLESSIDKITDRVKNFVESRKGKITYEENWGKRKLAYEIKKNEVGIYVLNYFEAPAEALAKIERDLRLTEEVIRFMVLATTDKVKANAKPRREKKEEKPDSSEAEEPTEKAAPKKAAPKKKKEEAPKESEAERMKKLDEQLGALLGDEEEGEKKPKSKK